MLAMFKAINDSDSFQRYAISGSKLAGWARSVGSRSYSVCNHLYCRLDYYSKKGDFNGLTRCFVFFKKILNLPKKKLRLYLHLAKELQLF